VKATIRARFHPELPEAWAGNLDVLYSKAELSLEVGKEQESVDAYDYLVQIT
jgi:hypothetical protein